MNESSQQSLKPYAEWSDGLRQRLQRRATQIATSALFVVAAVALPLGCGGSRTVFVPEQSPIRIGPAADMHVYTMVSGQWTLSSNKVRIPEGWYCVPPSYVEEAEAKEP